MKNTELYEAFQAVPENAKKEIYGGRLKGMIDINPQWRYEKLTEVLGPVGIGWKYEITKQWTEQIGDEVCAFTNILFYFKYNGEWSDPIPATGGSMLAALQKSGVYVSDECFKMSLTDALSVACKYLGVGADVYRGYSDSKCVRPSKEELEKKSANQKKQTENNISAIKSAKQHFADIGESEAFLEVIGDLDIDKLTYKKSCDTLDEVRRLYQVFKRKDRKNESK